MAHPPRGDLARLPWVSFLIIAVLVVVAVLAPLVAPHSPTEQSLPDKLRPPAWEDGGSAKHLLGTDVLGRDVLSRLIYGARVSLIVAAVALLAGGGVGLMVGIVAGYLGGRVDSFLMRVVDATLTFPTILIALLLAVSMGQGLQTIAIAITVLIWARFARVVRGEVLSVKARDFVALARVHGCSHPRIMAIHIVPNVLNTFMVLLTLHIGFVIIVEASLSFLGAGIPPPTPSWGQMWRTAAATSRALGGSRSYRGPPSCWSCSPSTCSATGFATGWTRACDRSERAPVAVARVVLEVRDLHAYLYTRWGVVRAVDGVSFALREGETLGLVGESGCGKTMTGLSVLRLLPEPAGRIVRGQVLLEGEDLVTKSESEMRQVR